MMSSRFTPRPGAGSLALIFRYLTLPHSTSGTCQSHTRSGFIASKAPDLTLVLFPLLQWRYVDAFEMCTAVLTANPSKAKVQLIRDKHDDGLTPDTAATSYM